MLIRVEFQFYDIYATSGEHCSKASTLFEAIDGTLTKDGLDWDNIVCVGLDNTNANIGNKNSIKSAARGVKVYSQNILSLLD